MDAALGWLGRLMDTIGRVFPRLVIVKSTHAGVSFKRGKHPRAVGPGLVVFWPVWTEIITYPVVRQSLNMPSQTLTTADGKTITISAVIIYSVSDILKALTVQWDLSETVADVSMSAIREYVVDLDFSAIRVDDTSVLRNKIAARVRRYGVAVSDAWITDLAETRVLTLVHPDGGGAAVVVDE